MRPGDGTSVRDGTDKPLFDLNKNSDEIVWGLFILLCHGSFGSTFMIEKKVKRSPKKLSGREEGGREGYWREELKEYTLYTIQHKDNVYFI